MKRREFMTLLGGAAAWPLTARAQQAGKVARIGFLASGSVSSWTTRVEAFRSGLAELGYVEGKNIAIEFRYAETVDELRTLVAELVAVSVDVILASSSNQVEPARQVTQKIPIRVRHPC